jgi:hypothetical protein
MQPAPGKLARLVGQEVVGHEVLGAGKPVEGDLGEDDALAGDAVGQHDVEGGEAVGGDEQQGVAQVEDLPDLARADWGVGQVFDGEAGSGGQQTGEIRGAHGDGVYLMGWGGSTEAGKTTDGTGGKKNPCAGGVGAYVSPFHRARPHRLARSRTPPFHGENRGSNPRGDASGAGGAQHFEPRRGLTERSGEGRADGAGRSPERSEPIPVGTPAALAVRSTSNPGGV